MLYRAKCLRLKVLIVAAALLAPNFTGCGPYLSTSMEVPEIPVGSADAGTRASLGEIGESSAAPSSHSVAIERIVDLRQSPVIVTRGDDAIELIGDVGIRVSDAVKRALLDKGFSVSAFGENSVRGQVKTWRAAVESSLNGTLESEAAIFIEVFNKREQRIFSGEFRGSAKSQTPLISNSDVQESLGKAMAKAIEELITDSQFLEAISA